MAFEWNWRGSQNAYDAYKTAEDLASQRYWANRDYIDAQNQAIADQYAAQGMRGVANPVLVYGNTNGMVNKYGPLFNPRAASVAEIKAMQGQIGTKADGAWGPKSQRAYNKYMQNMMGVTADGIWGPMSQAAYDAGSYNPATAAYQEAYANAQAAYEQQQALEQQQQAQAQQDALRAEYAQNEQRIAQIKLEIAKLEGEAGRSMDELDMRLAANRANAGDIGNAISHQNRIITRQQLANANGGKSASDTKAEELVKEYITTESMMKMGDNKARPGYQNQLRYLKYQIDKDPKAKKLLEKFNGTIKNRNIEETKTFQDFQNIESDLRTANANNPFKKNGLTKADKEAIDEYWYSLPKEVREANKDYYNKIRGEEDIETVEKRGKALAKKQEAALDEAIKPENIQSQELDDGKSYTHNASNGQSVTVKPVSSGPRGGRTAIATCGKKSKTFKY
jgi:hypothetical protein